MAAEDKLSRVHLELVDGLRFNVTFPDVSGSAAVTIDEEPPIGRGAGPNPAALLGAAIGGCLAASLAYCMKKARVPAAQVSVDVRTRIARNASGRFRVNGVDVDLSVVSTEHDAAKLERCGDLFEDFCTVTESVRAGIPVSVHLMMPPAGGAV